MPPPRARRGSGARRSTRKRTCWNTPRDRDPDRSVAKGSRCGHQTEAGGRQPSRPRDTSRENGCDGAAKAAEVQGNAEAAKLIARASALLGQGDIGAARIVLERASESGNAKASFMLAETYDPAILTAWGTYGTRGEVTKARELYAKAHAGGIQEAKN